MLLADTIFFHNQNSILCEKIQYEADKIMLLFCFLTEKNTRIISLLSQLSVKMLFFYTQKMQLCVQPFSVKTV
jgi:hypothetical protein